MVKRVLKIYIAGPMTGYPDYNRAAFNAKAIELMAEGHIVLNPAVLPGGLCQSEYMDICLAMVRSADAIYLLNRWEESVGARAEHALAEKLGLTVIYESPTNIECQVAPHIYRDQRVKAGLLALFMTLKMVQFVSGCGRRLPHDPGYA